MSIAVHSRGYLILTVIAGCGGMLLAESESPDEARVKTAVVLQLARFVEWPPDATNFPQFTICLADKDSWIEPLDQVTRGQTVGGKAILVRRINKPEDSPSCRVAILGPGTKASLRAAITKLPVLTIGDDQDSLASGSMVSLAVQNGRVAFALSPKNARRTGIRFSSKLIRLAHIPAPED